jgi:arginyl-tRNA synthetase
MKQYFRAASDLLTETLGEESAPAGGWASLLERPQKEEFGDIAFPCFQLAKAKRMAPPILAQQLAQTIAPKEPFSKIHAVGPYLNFVVSPKAAALIANSALEKGAAFGSPIPERREKILLEYSSPNVAKELHIGHFRNTMLGQALCNLYRFAGHEVIALNHLGDWGAQFGRVAWGFLKYGNEEELKKDPLGYLTSLYVRVSREEQVNPAIDQEARLLFKKIEEGDPALKALWQRFCTLSITGLKSVYARLGVEFDRYIGESFYVPLIGSLLEELEKKSLLVRSEGALVVEMEAEDPPCLIVTKDGTSLYATRDLAAAIWRQSEFKFDRSLYVVGNEQQLHLRQVFQVLTKMGHEWAASLEHIGYGLYRFKDGKFSTRQGKVILAAEVLDEAQAKALQLISTKNPKLENREEVAEMVGVGAVIFNDLLTDRHKDVEFDWEKIIDFEGDTGPYLQYSFARASSIIRQAESQGFSLEKLGATRSSFGDIQSIPAAVSLMKELGRLELSVEGAIRLGKPSIVARFALDLCHRFNGFYREVRVLDPAKTKEQVAERLLLVQAFQQTLKNTLRLLCVPTPAEM